MACPLRKTIRMSFFVLSIAIATGLLVLGAGSWRLAWYIVGPADSIGGDGWDEVLDATDGYVAVLLVHRAVVKVEYRSSTKPKVVPIGNRLQWLGLAVEQRQAALYCDYPTAYELSRELERYFSGQPGRTWITSAQAPLLPPLVALIAWPVVALVRGPLREHRRQKLHQCLHCGYSLHGLPEPRCPECGRQDAWRRC